MPSRCRRLVDAQAILVGQLGGASTFGAVTDAFRFWHWRFEGGGRLEVLEPAGAAGFLHRFLAQRGPGIHHVTFTVPSLVEACDRARLHGYSIVGYDDSEPEVSRRLLANVLRIGYVRSYGNERGGLNDQRCGRSSPRYHLQFAGVSRDNERLVLVHGFCPQGADTTSFTRFGGELTFAPCTPGPATSRRIARLRGSKSAP